MFLMMVSYSKEGGGGGIDWSEEEVIGDWGELLGLRKKEGTSGIIVGPFYLV